MAEGCVVDGVECGVVTEWSGFSTLPVQSGGVKKQWTYISGKGVPLGETDIEDEDGTFIGRYRVFAAPKNFPAIPIPEF